MEKNTFLVLSLDDERISKVAEVMSNKTSIRILKLLSNKSLTESEIAEQLRIPLSTVHYNIQKLLEAGLIEAKEYHYSKKGKEINHYAVSKQYVIFAHKIEEKSIIKEFSKILTSILISLVTLSFINYLKLNFLRRDFPTLKQEVAYESVQVLKSTSTQPQLKETLQKTTLYHNFFIFIILLILSYLIISFLLSKFDFKKILKNYKTRKNK
ncbi:MAG: helix-turn-helix domain-containing protein [Candidatus Woesearchaeota archaeon]